MKKNKKSDKQFTGYDSGFDMWRDYKERYGIITAYCICRRYLKTQTVDVTEQEFCQQLRDAMTAEPNMTDVDVYRHSKNFAELNSEIYSFEKSYRTNHLCAGDIDEAVNACSYGDGSVDYQDALTALTTRYGLERLRFVLGCEIRSDFTFQRYPKEFYTWANEMKIHENYGSYEIRTRPEVLSGLITELLQTEREMNTLKTIGDDLLASIWSDINTLFEIGIEIFRLMSETSATKGEAKGVEVEKLTNGAILVTNDKNIQIAIDKSAAKELLSEEAIKHGHNKGGWFLCFHGAAAAIPLYELSRNNAEIRNLIVSEESLRTTLCGSFPEYVKTYNANAAPENHIKNADAPPHLFLQKQLDNAADKTRIEVNTFQESHARENAMGHGRFDDVLELER